MQLIRRAANTVGGYVDFGSIPYSNKTHFPSEKNKTIYRSAKQKLDEKNIHFGFPKSLKDRTARFPSFPSYGPFSIKPIFTQPKRGMATSSPPKEEKKFESTPKPTPSEPQKSDPKNHPKKQTTQEENDMDAGYDPFPFYPEFQDDLRAALLDELWD